MIRSIAASIVMCLVLFQIGGCTTAAALGGLANLGGGMAQNFEYQKELQILPKYSGLEGKRIAVVVDADMSLLYDYPALVNTVTGGVTARIGHYVPNASLVNPDAVIAWQWRTPQWNALPYGQIAQTLNVERVVHIEIYEFRLNPPGNRWLWEGVAGANVSVIEADAIDPDLFVDTFPIVAKFPQVEHIDRSHVAQADVEKGLLYKFIQEITWLFHEHLEPKYPDKYQGDLKQAEEKNS